MGSRLPPLHSEMFLLLANHTTVVLVRTIFSNLTWLRLTTCIATSSPASDSDSEVHHGPFHKNSMSMSNTSAESAELSCLRRQLLQAQAKVSGDPEMHSMMELVARTNMLEGDTLPNRYTIPGPLTGPANVHVENVFDRQFLGSESPVPEEPLPVQQLEAVEVGRGGPDLRLALIFPV